ncbi:MAG: RNA-binding protein [Candidatus Diapherotrites archaeon CG08_land_8_20_14_0_20_34_12]|nr:MAG: RNA-binding protein [Candidatus Diapherotrites archaeon CG08_land_8_20_14_0_20_34_12]
MESDSALWELKKEKVLAKMRENKRIDDRDFLQYRDIKIEQGLFQNAEGSCKVTLGETVVYAGVKMVPGDPYPDMPDEGTISVLAEFMPLASPTFEPGPPSKESNELARVVDRGIRGGKCLDSKALCIRAGEKVWVVFIDMYIANDGGNLFDAGSLASVGALLNAKIPKYEDDKLVQGEYSGDLEVKTLPILTTCAKIGNTIIADPSLVEEKAMSARFSATTLEDGRICAIQKGGAYSFTKDEVKRIMDISMEKGKELRNLLR